MVLRKSAKKKRPTKGDHAAVSNRQEESAGARGFVGAESAVETGWSEERRGEGARCGGRSARELGARATTEASAQDAPRRAGGKLRGNAWQGTERAGR